MSTHVCRGGQGRRQCELLELGLGWWPFSRAPAAEDKQCPGLPTGHRHHNPRNLH